MVETTQQRPGGRLGRDHAVRHLGAGPRLHIAREKLRGAHMQGQVHPGQLHLAHRRAGRPEISGRGHLGENRVGDGRPGFVVPGQEVETRALPTPVFHDLRGQLDEVPGDVHAVERLDLHFAKQVVQQVAELVENGLNLPVREQRRPALPWRSEVAADVAEVGRPGAVRPRTARHQVAHPGAATLRFARMPVGVKRAEPPAAGVVQVVILNLGVPGLEGSGRALGDPQAEDLSHQLEQTRDDAPHREIRPQHLLVEIIPQPPQALRPVSDFPGLEPAGRLPGLRRLEGLQLVALAPKGGTRPVLQVRDEGQRLRPGPGHPALQHKVGEMRLAQQRRLLRAQGQDAAYQLGVVMRGVHPDRDRSRPALLPQAFVAGIGHDGFLRGAVQGETPCRALRGAETLFLRRGPRRRHRVLRQTAQPRRIVGHQLPGVGRIQHVLGIFLRELREFSLQGFQPRPLRLRQVRAGLAEIGYGLVQKTPVDAGQSFGGRRRRHRLESRPQSRVEGDPRIKGRNCREQRVVCLAQRRGVGHRLQVGDLAPGKRQLLGGLLQR